MGLLMRLSRKTIDRLPHTVKRPDYDLGPVTVGIVHLGIGAFHRAHQAAYTDALLSENPSWGICGVSLRSPETRDALQPQDGLYTLAVQDGEGSDLSVIGSVVELLCAPEDPEAVLRRMADPATRIVSLTITEKGYCHNPATGTLDEGHPDIVHDLANPARPRSAIGFIVEAISRRVSAGIAPFTLLSCDNLPGNGHVLKRIVMQFAELRDPALAAVIRNVASPSTMVDRIVPATTDGDRSAVAAAMGLEDAWPIMTEPFRQWVIEEDFPLGRPAWEKAGALFVQDVSAFEFMKLRLLNGSHSTLAYLGYLAGAETVADAMSLPGMEALVEGLMRHEVSPTLPELPGFDLPAYRAELLQRFRNPALRHRTWQIAMDGSQKLPQRLLGSIRDRLHAEAGYDRLALGVAAWMRYARGLDEAGRPIDVRDPHAARIAGLAQGIDEPDRIVDAFLTMTDVFGTDLPASAPFRAALIKALDGLLRNGSAATLRSYGA
ncbi:mannitol dehydrogenase family protein [Sinorhizobium prairiense]|uniref:mannitol dehydrogenase family protein n=1 Tax=unclassified Sinorhizobium TaxID=2613772 RepID=UPI0023D854F0|nr:MULTISPECIES: mannitol dehydrogenase family protein [unclassified Sinorhizobium]WEJ13649.1 mannitol dehydrogenase family protein [Sinorhizobium sp. M103]WEJ18748.1 mannitol dehydrogenase family protein [Sinorhizobium sp. K101]WEJ39321.1 mannitol dehydrogenase family protein [Sinorhizobium sp. C101]